MQKQTEIVIMRAGTSKGIFIKQSSLPVDIKERDALILKIFGSPDIRQIDGLGGADPLTSKLAIIGPSTREDADIDYTFGQVSYVAAKIDYSGNCGNISSGVAPFAIDEGMVSVKEPFTTVRIHNTNTDRILEEKIEISQGLAKVDGEYSIAGVPGTGAEITIDFSDTAGASTGNLLPTGNVKDRINIDGIGKIDFSLVDAANAVVFVRAEDFGLVGIETPKEIDSNKKLLDQIEEARSKGAQMMGMIDDWKKAKEEIPAFPMIALISKAQDYTDFTSGKKISKENIDFVSRLMFMQVVHKTYAGTATICTGVAAKVAGTIVSDAMVEKNNNTDTLHIGHPAGAIRIDVATEKVDEGWKLNKAIISRTARRILKGFCYTS